MFNVRKCLSDILYLAARFGLKDCSYIESDIYSLKLRVWPEILIMDTIVVYMYIQSNKFHKLKSVFGMHGKPNR